MLSRLIGRHPAQGEPNDDRASGTARPVTATGPAPSAPRPATPPAGKLEQEQKQMIDAKKSPIGYRPDGGRSPADMAAVPPRSGLDAPAQEPEGSRLIVGRNIQLKGEITACDTLVVEGRVEASMNSRIIEIAESGLFSGNAEIETANISGRFEGNLTVSGRLAIHSTGVVSGTIRYGEIVIEAGGQISGDVQVLGKGRSAALDKPLPPKEAPAPTQSAAKPAQWSPNGKSQTTGAKL